ncbi:prolyl oligopeptidase family serine peptidase [Alicyclobacillus sp.]|uniref:S9 family peptidase n=1 Tax=Alicyclobacillus sp. TaxID=61169 RepID=UPI0025B93F90|nr:prolyl oligopeptidase family serine peptidase [Alicyclobacillus sp.]MCL6516060.1 prolyl oligopeptidase family serine peptidase [Alicyclobacillus sp.]
MVHAKTAPYGSWKSPITSDLIVQASIGLESLAWDGADLYWLESRPREGGRNVLMRRTAAGGVEEVTPAPFNVRTRVHEYGGGAWVVSNGRLVFSNFEDNRLYIREADGRIRPLTEDSRLRYADGVIDQRRGLWIGVREDHTESDIFAVNTLVAIPLDGGPDRVLVSGGDFYSNPRLSPTGDHLAWITWNHPNMPWDGTELWVADVSRDGELRNPRRVAGGPAESVLQPRWSPDGVLYFVSDRSDWWNLYRLREDGRVEAVHPMQAEFAGPPWVFGLCDYTFVDARTLVCRYTQGGRDHLVRIDTVDGRMDSLSGDDTWFGHVHSNGHKVAYLAASPVSFRRLMVTGPDGGQPEVVRVASEVPVDPKYFSVPRSITFPTEGGREAYAHYYPPHNPDHTAPAGEKPPLLVHVHGGPTSASPAVLSLSTQYWTSRGFAVVDVNYGGSTGYGRAYRERLKGRWGVTDVDDAVNAALHLVRQGWVDENRLCIAGGSAGGYTTLAALTFRDVFHAGASHFGLSDLEIFVHETHKFESRYMDSLLGPYPEAKSVYHDRSPIHFTDRLSCPIIFFQGLDDRIVPPNQAERMVEALRRKGLPVAYVAFPGEGHGFRRAKNIQRALDGEFYFYSRVFGFTPADPIEPVPIENL